MYPGMVRRIPVIVFFTLVALSGIPFAVSVYKGAWAAETPKSAKAPATFECESAHRALSAELLATYTNELRSPPPELNPLAGTGAYAAIDESLQLLAERCPHLQEQTRALRKVRFALSANVDLLRELVGKELSVLRPR